MISFAGKLSPNPTKSDSLYYGIVRMTYLQAFILIINMQFYGGRGAGGIWSCFTICVSLASFMVIGCVHEEDIQSIADVTGYFKKKKKKTSQLL